MERLREAAVVRVRGFQLRVTVTLCDAVAPEGPVAVIVMVLKPVSSGMVTLQVDVPDAAPDWPKLLDQATDEAPVAVPVKVIDEALVETEVAEGDEMVRVVEPLLGVVGDVGDVGEVGGGGALSRVAVTDCETCVESASTAVTVMVLLPTFNGTWAMVHVLDPDAVPEDPLADQVTTTGFFPPVVVPLSPMIAAVVVAAGGATVSVNALAGVGVGVGVGVGLGEGAGAGAGGAVEVCGAYIVWIVATSSGESVVCME
jgi:hypothetical protein